ncbi:DNA-binding LacI/PurR family transcriptional regulator [Bacillus ectoiniformans]|uniref:LacI family DNA-binding transcriptional regulator n=1 Tax=Bacillus ectoiniformans TaxID=1494429 RepID=UPI001958F010|nr:LacI family DNA-binding transcriptional regulator [Bacillus ectoiniformans]MBM7649583.1 DNA-binding LacI/PurR family transcriptional regulator [Bacillus ectoiniformans]
MVTIKDVAKLANVAPSTVSRVIANNPRISEATALKVKKAMKELGYHPNFQARSLAGKKTQTIGLVMPDSTDKVFQNPFFPEVIRGISKMAHEQQYALNISTGETEQEIYESVVGMVQGRRVDGFILLYSRINDRVTNFLRKKQFPFAVVGKPCEHIDEITHVDTNNFAAAQMVTEYLIQLGHRRIAFVGGATDLVVTMDRVKGYKAAIESAGLAVMKDYIVSEKSLQAGGREAVAQLMSLTHRPTAIIAMDDLLAFGMLNMLHELGLVVPAHVSLVAFNNILLTEMSNPPLTTVDIQIFQLGYQATKCLIERLNDSNEPVKRLIVPHQLIERSSCKPLHDMMAVTKLDERESR